MYGTKQFARGANSLSLSLGLGLELFFDSPTKHGLVIKSIPNMPV
jgi:hypothetical protein